MGLEKLCNKMHTDNPDHGREEERRGAFTTRSDLGMGVREGKERGSGKFLGKMVMRLRIFTR